MSATETWVALLIGHLMEELPLERKDIYQKHRKKYNPQRTDTSSNMFKVLIYLKKKVNANFVLFTRKSSGTKIAADNIPLSYNSSLPTHFITHGFIQNAQKQWVGEMKDALLRTKDLNVIAVDWKKGADFPYAQASANTQITGAEIAKLVKILVEKTGADIGEFHLIGHSLGAHVSGYAGERLKGLGRITGLVSSDS